VTIGQFRRFAEESGYRTEAERDGRGGWGVNGKTGKFEGRRPCYSWRNPGFPQDDSHPVVNVTWNDAVAFRAWLSKRAAYALTSRWASWSSRLLSRTSFS
jgi:formylglycine-generating enzyme required for sulfatase activity